MRFRCLWIATLATATAHAVVVRGTVSGPLGKPVPGARVQLIGLTQLGSGPRAVGDAISGIDGTYEIRTDLSGRFLLLTSSAVYAPQLGTDFYAGRTDLLTRDVTLDFKQVAAAETGLPNGMIEPLAQLTSPVTQVPADRLLLRALLPDELPLTPGTVLNTAGQMGQPTELLFRGAGPEANAVLLDGSPVQRLGGGFGFGALAATGFSTLALSPAIELAAGPDPLYPLAAEAGTIALTTAHASNLRPVLLYAGDAGNLHTWRDELLGSLTRRRLDLLGAVSRLDSSNALLDDRFHVAAVAANIGYNISAATTLRAIGRYQVSAAPLPIPYDLGLTPETRDADQQIAGTFTFATSTAGNWRNLVRYGLDREREQTFDYADAPGRPVTITGANGYSTTGEAQLPTLPARQDEAIGRDTITYQTDYPFTSYLAGLFSATYQLEHGLYLARTATPVTTRNTLTRENLFFTGALRAELKHRLFGEASGSFSHSNLFGFTGSPRIGATYAPVLPSSARKFHGTVLHATVATGSREPSVFEQAQGASTPARSRTLSTSVDQNLYRARLTLNAGYFHNEFSHQTEMLAGMVAGLLAPLTVSQTLAYRTQGLTTEVRYQPTGRLLLRGGYGYLASLVEQSAATPAFNPALPAMAIGATTSLTGARPFRRPPETGFFAVQYSGGKLTANLQGSLAGRSDDSTYTTPTPALLLPNRNLDHGYTRLDAGLTYPILRRATVYTQLENLLNDQHIGPIGYPGLPFTVRAGLRIRIGGE